MRSHIARRTVAVLSVVLGACGGNREKSPRVERSPTATAADCTDSVETRALACSGGTARRVGNTLFVRLGTGTETRFVDNASAEDNRGYDYRGRIASNRFHLIQSYGNEQYPHYHVLNGSTGKSVVTDDVPLFSPDARRFAIGGYFWDNCSEANGQTWKFGG